MSKIFPATTLSQDVQNLTYAITARKARSTPSCKAGRPATRDLAKVISLYAQLP